jgi:hypothetical protein
MKPAPARLAALFSLMALLGLLLGAVLPAAAQAAGITLSVEAGFGGRFREGLWFPVFVSISNTGDDIAGRLIVRPETSGDGLPNAFSVPITLAGGARQAVPLFISARSYTSQLRVEFMDDDNVVLAAQAAPLRSITPMDRLYLVFSESPLGSVDLSGAAFGGATAAQANWSPADVPESADALRAVSLMLFDDVDTTGLSAAQLTALRAWVVGGGHLVVAGGPNWQATALALADLLPLTPEQSISISTLRPLAEWLAQPETAGDALDSAGGVIVTTGTLLPEARVLVSAPQPDAEPVPLLVRRTLGAGVVDFLAADVNNAPLRGWPQMAEFWRTLQSTRGPVPSWVRGFSDFDQAARATEILPGVDPLPDVLPLLLFLGLYVALIGPLNYLLLNRLNRLDWAWATIPVCILLFSLVAWRLGISLRGDDAILNRLTVVQSWPGESRAQAFGLVGVFSPRRTQYSLSTPAEALLRPLPGIDQTSGLVAQGGVSALEVEERAGFTARDFNVDASFTTSFTVDSPAPTPALIGSALMEYEPLSPGQMRVRGTVRNESDLTFSNAAILARGASVRLSGALPPGSIGTFDLLLPGDGPASPAPYLPTRINPFLTFRFAGSTSESETTAADIMGPGRYDPDPMLFGGSASDDLQRLWQEQLVLWSLVDDAFGATGRGDQVFVAAWTDRAPVDLALDGGDWVDQQHTLVLTTLETTVQPPGVTVTISSDRFTWSVESYLGLGALTPVNLSMQPNENVTFRFTPQPGAVLREVDSLDIQLVDLSVSTRQVPMYLWDWRAQTWDAIEVSREGLRLQDPARYLGPENAVQIRLVSDEIGGFLRIGRLDIEQTGRF